LIIDIDIIHKNNTLVFILIQEKNIRDMV
jgi:hypothetical protein